MPVHPLVRTSANLACCAAAAALLSACATRPQISAQQESTIYRSHAGRDYTPPGPASDPWGPYIREASDKFDVPDRWIREVMHQESGGKLYHGGSLVTSGAGAMGLMQVMPQTYDEIRGRYPELGDDPYDPHNNILAGTAYIREMYDIYGSPGFLAAYNAGPGRVDDYLTNNRTLPEETRRYVAAIGPRIAGTEPRAPSPGQQYALNAGSISYPQTSRYASSSRYSAPVDAPIRLSPQAYPAPQPVQVAAAAPIRLSPQPELAPLPVPIQVATPGPASQGGPYIVLHPQPIEVAEAPEPVAAPAPVQQSRPAPLVVAAPLPEPPAPSRVASVPVSAVPAYNSRATQFAQIPEPPRPAPYFTPPREARTQQQLAAASPRPGVAARVQLLLVHAGQCRADRRPAHRLHVRQLGRPGRRLRQRGPGVVGHQLSPGNMRTTSLASARTSVTAVHEPHGMLYRARLTGLSRDSAAQACERLARTRTNCIVVSPDAAS